MTIRVVDGDQIHGKFNELLKNFMPFAQKKLGYKKPVDVQLVSDPDNAKDPLGKTAYYDPNLMRITVFVDKRHVKDILRSLSHELVHHKQNCEGELSDIAAEEGYAQSDPHLREMEIEAEDKTNTLLFRDWEDNLKGDKQMYEEIMQEARERANGVVNEAWPAMAGAAGGEPVGDDMTGGPSALDEPSATTAGSKLEAFKEKLRMMDGVNPEMVDAVAEAADSVYAGSMNEGLRKLRYSAHANKESAKDVTKKIKKRIQENSNWAREGKDDQLYNELRDRWCK